jgi:hypothetical protein
MCPLKKGFSSVVYYCFNLAGEVVFSGSVNETGITASDLMQSVAIIIGL